MLLVGKSPFFIKTPSETLIEKFLLVKTTFLDLIHSTITTDTINPRYTPVRREDGCDERDKSPPAGGGAVVAVMALLGWPPSGAVVLFSGRLWRLCSTAPFAAFSRLVQRFLGRKFKVGEAHTPCIFS